MTNGVFTVHFCKQNNNNYYIHISTAANDDEARALCVSVEN